MSVSYVRISLASHRVQVVGITDENTAYVVDVEGLIKETIEGSSFHIILRSIIDPPRGLVREHISMTKDQFCLFISSGINIIRYGCVRWHLISSEDVYALQQTNGRCTAIYRAYASPLIPAPNYLPTRNAWNLPKVPKVPYA